MRSIAISDDAARIAKSNRISVNPKLQEFYQQFGNGDGLFYMGHASILGVFSGRKILFDPVILSRPYANAWAFFPPQVEDPSIFDVDAVVVSHIHQDHYDIEYLKSLNGRAKIIILGGRASFVQDLQSDKINNLFVIEPETVTELFPGVSIYGVLHETNGIDSSCVVFNDNFCIYHGNDNYLQPSSLKKFTEIGRRIDVACIPYAYIHWYPFLLDYGPGKEAEKAAEADRLVKLYFDDCITSAPLLRSKVVIPFGANLLLDDGDAYSAINLAVKTPVEFYEYAKDHTPRSIHDSIKPMLAGDSCGILEGELNITIHNIYDSSSYRAQADVFLKSRQPRKGDDGWIPIDKQLFIDQLDWRLKSLGERHQNTIRLELNYLNELLRIEIDLDSHVSRFVDRFSEGKPYHHFTLDPIASGLWLNGSRFEEIIGSRRFTLRREPNVYSKDVLRIVSTII